MTEDARNRRTITGIPSGDLECWCLLVDRATFIAIKGTEPQDLHGEEHEYRGDVGRFAVPGSPYRYMLYPSDLIPGSGCGKLAEEPPVTFTIEILNFILKDGRWYPKGDGK